MGPKGPHGPGRAGRRRPGVPRHRPLPPRPGHVPDPGDPARVDQLDERTAAGCVDLLVTGQLGRGRGPVGRSAGRGPWACATGVVSVLPGSIATVDVDWMNRVTLPRARSGDDRLRRLAADVRARGGRGPLRARASTPGPWPPAVAGPATCTAGPSTTSPSSSTGWPWPTSRPSWTSVEGDLPAELRRGHGRGRAGPWSPTATSASHGQLRGRLGPLPRPARRRRGRRRAATGGSTDRPGRGPAGPVPAS